MAPLSRFDWALSEFSPQWSISAWVLELVNFIFWLLLGLFLVWLAWRLWPKLRPYFDSWLAGTNNSTNDKAKTVESELSVAQLLMRSQEFSRQGHYRQACRYLYFAMLQHFRDEGSSNSRLFEGPHVPPGRKSGHKAVLKRYYTLYYEEANSRGYSKVSTRAEPSLFPEHSEPLIYQILLVQYPVLKVQEMPCRVQSLIRSRLSCDR